MKYENTSRRDEGYLARAVDGNQYADLLARIRLTLSLLEGDVGRLRKDLKRLEENLRSLIELINKM